MRIPRCALVFGLLVTAAYLPLAPNASGQIQSTITCPSGNGYWDVLSVMMMDPGLASGYHMEGITAGLPSSYIYTLWDTGQSKVYYIKNPQGNPWDINLYDANYIYQWVTELGMWNDGVNHWNDPTSCRKFNNGGQNNKSDLSMRWAARCVAPGGKNSAFWNPPPSGQSSNTNYYTYVGREAQRAAQNLGYSLLEVKHTAKASIIDHRVNPPLPSSITTLPLQYTYSCSVSGNVNSCKSREVFLYGVDANVNPVDGVRHSYGWIGWYYYINLNAGNPAAPAIWKLTSQSISDHLMPGQVSPNFQCF